MEKRRNGEWKGGRVHAVSYYTEPLKTSSEPDLKLVCSDYDCMNVPQYWTELSVKKKHTLFKIINKIMSQAGQAYFYLRALVFVVPGAWNIPLETFPFACSLLPLLSFRSLCKCHPNGLHWPLLLKCSLTPHSDLLFCFLFSS